MWLVSGLKDHRYRSVKREAYRCQWTDHCQAQTATECSGTSQTAAKLLLLDLLLLNLPPHPMTHHKIRGDQKHFTSDLQTAPGPFCPEADVQQRTTRNESTESVPQSPTAACPLTFRRVTVGGGHPTG